MILQTITIWEGKDREEMTFCWCWLVYQTGKRNCFEAELAFKPSFGIGNTLTSRNCKGLAFS